ncbi:CPBP family intramembrane glutamic endopeptidase [Nakamurella sp. PAMC28650]|uniref:CPBP family intramembrane glutamic endopeptidase n=1 Tax=Nakamurella sp. PAMC28650 TaxID=2762325 RepID=UPI00164E0008|nr:type II CAAX endopeptidase family protein [Nakamurella sp. PAMC28650]QNK83229.1 CPBP family intramembrane metalloprotease [Nakamurella sp. PAMC28650]
MTDASAPAVSSHHHSPRRPDEDLLAYILLAYGLSWLWLLPLALAGLVVQQGHGWPTHFPALLGPMVAAVLVAARSGSLRRLLTSMVRINVALRWWAWAVSPLLLLGVALIADRIAGRQLPGTADFAQMSGLPLSLGVIGVAAVVLLVNGFGEETGWRGFALPALQRRLSPLRAMLVLSLIWAGWHLPMFLVIDNFRTFTAGTVVGWLLGLMAGSIVLGWLYNRSGGSIALVAVWHAGFDMVTATAAASDLVAAVVSTVVMVQAVVLVGAELSARRRGRPSVLIPQSSQ